MTEQEFTVWIEQSDLRSKIDDMRQKIDDLKNDLYDIVTDYILTVHDAQEVGIPQEEVIEDYAGYVDMYEELINYIEEKGLDQ